ncbi:hypothetical protein QQP08_000278 [Theobroma cacao]|nr:hypothetical protein QQP08_000278 [Theobroma cacao]
MASAKRILAFLLMLAFSGVLLGAVYKVGDSASWSMKRNIDFFFPFFNLRFRASGSATFSVRRLLLHLLSSWPLQAGQKADVLVKPSFLGPEQVRSPSP